MEPLSAMSRVHHCQVCRRLEASQANFRCWFGRCSPLKNFVCLDNKAQFLCERDVEHAKVVKRRMESRTDLGETASPPFSIRA